MEERLSDRILEYLLPARGREVSLRDIRAYLKIEAGSNDDKNLRNRMSTTMVTNKVVKPSGRKDGVYKVLSPITDITKVRNGNKEPLDFRWPRAYSKDGNGEWEVVSMFGLEDLVEVFAGDLILIMGRTNFGKTTLVVNILAENIALMDSILMGSEYTANDGNISPKFERRMRRMAWAELINEDGSLNFKLRPVDVDYEDHIEPDTLNAIDWISLPGEYYLIDRVIKTIKDGVGEDGIAVAVIQKNKDAEFGEGGERAERYADVVLKIDSFGEESMLTVGKVKSKKKSVVGRMWAFDIVDYGANFFNIREIVKCTGCWGKGYKRSGQNYIKCDTCNGKKFISKN